MKIREKVKFFMTRWTLGKFADGAVRFELTQVVGGRAPLVIDLNIKKTLKINFLKHLSIYFFSMKTSEIPIK